MKETTQTIKTVDHINYPDKTGRVYCRLKNFIRTMDKDGKFWEMCKKCPYFAGDYQGDGVECSWKDIVDSEDFSVYSSDPTEEVLRVSKLIDTGLIDK